MITTMSLMGFVLMSVRKVQQETEGWKPTAREAAELEEKLKPFSAKIVNGRKQYPFELYLESKDIISFGAFGQIQVKNPLMYYRMNKTDSLREWIADQEMEKMFNAFPEERETHKVKMSEIIKKFKVASA